MNLKQEIAEVMLVSLRARLKATQSFSMNAAINHVESTLLKEQIKALEEVTSDNPCYEQTCEFNSFLPPCRWQWIEGRATICHNEHSPHFKWPCTKRCTHPEK